MQPPENSFIVIFLLTMTLHRVQSEFKLLLLHTNDMHSRFEETNAHSGQCLRGKCYGGFARLKTAVEQFRKDAKDEGRSTIFLNAGDTFQGTVYYTMFKWRVVSELLNMMNIDVMSLGNHEFDDGPEGLAPFIANSSTPIVSCNIDYSKEHVLADNANLTKLVPSWVLHVDGVKVGVIGYLTPETKFLAKTDQVSILDEITEIKKEVTRLKEEGVKILIALGHSGYTTDMLIAEKVPDLDVVIGGHTNTFLFSGKAPDIEKPEGAYPTVVTQPSGRKVLVVQAYAYTKYLGHLKLNFDDQGEIVHSEGNPVLIDESFRKDGEVERAILKYGNQVKALAKRKVGSSRSFLEADHLTCRTRECNFGNLVTDAMVDANSKDFFGKGWTDAPVAFLQGGGLRTSISTEDSGGTISYSDLLTTMPFQNTVERLTLKGSVLRQAMEHSVSRYSTVERVGGFLQYSGIHVKYDLSKPPQQRVVSATVRCGACPVPKYLPLDSDEEYHVLTSSFLADGGDGYTMLKGVKERKTMSFTDVDAIETYLLRVSPVNPELSGRIQFVEHPAPSQPNSASDFSACARLMLLTMALLKMSTAYLTGR